MPNQYLVDIHRYISETLKEIGTLLENARNAGDEMKTAFFKGQLEELTDIKNSLAEAYNLATHSYP